MYVTPVIITKLSLNSMIGLASSLVKVFANVMKGFIPFNYTEHMRISPGSSKRSISRAYCRVRFGTARSGIQSVLLAYQRPHSMTIHPPIHPLLRKTVMPSEDSYAWGVGEDVDLITLLPMFNPAYTHYAVKFDFWNYPKGKDPEAGPTRR